MSNQDLTSEARTRHRRRLAGALAGIVPDLPAGEREEAAEAILSVLFDWRRADGGPCLCPCHPQLPTTDLHDFGFDCDCRLTTSERRTRLEERLTGQDAYWRSPEGRAEMERERQEQRE